MRASRWFFCVALCCSGAAAHAEETYPRSVPPPPGAAEPVYRRLEVPSRDGTKLVVHEWTPPQAPPGGPVLLFLPGIGMHGEPYASVAAGFTARGVTWVVPDLRGHGRSGGPRGDLAEPHVLRADLGAVIDDLRRRRPGAVLVLGGESMGGLLAADYAWRGEQRLAGLALLAPAFSLRFPPPGRLSDLRDLPRLGTISLEADGVLAASTHDPGFIKARKGDRLALHEVPWGYLASLGRLQVECLQAPTEVRVPLFVGVAGREEVIDNGAAERFYAAAGAAPGQKAWRKWREARHTLFWDPLAPEVVKELADWALALRP